MTKSVLLLDDDEGESNTTTTLKINEKYATKYQEKKKKEELSILEDKYREKLAKKGAFKGQGNKREEDSKMSPSDTEDDDEDEDSESDTVEDEDGDLVTPAMEVQILKTLAEIRARNGKIYDPSVQFFSREELAAAEAEWRAKRKANDARPIRLKDYHRERLLKGLVNGSQDEDEEDQEERLQTRILTHEEEQAELLRAFTSSANLTDDKANDAEDGALFRVRKKTDEEVAKEDEEYKKFLLENLATNENARESMGEWFAARDRYCGDGSKDQTSTNGGPTGDEAFLIEYIMNRGWIDRDRRTLPTYDQIVDGTPGEDLEEDERAVEEAEAFEERYNFRFEQPGGDQIATYGRNIGGSLRREDDKRKEQREARKKRKALEKLKQHEELKRLKNLKRQEIEERLHKIRAISGAQELPKDIDLDSDFDPEAHDRRMGAIFNDSYYEQDEKKPVFSDDQGEIGGDDEKGHDLGTHIVERATEAVGQAAKKARRLGGGNRTDDLAKESNNLAMATGMGKYLDEYYQLDYEDMIGDLPCRFKYTTVRPTTFGLNLTDILRADESTLNAHVSLRKLAPYRNAEMLSSDEQKYATKKRLYKFYDLLSKEEQGEEGSKGKGRRETGGGKRHKATRNNRKSNDK